MNKMGKLNQTKGTLARGKRKLFRATQSHSLQSRPIQMRGTILYLANRWMDFKMLSTPNSF